MKKLTTLKILMLMSLAVGSSNMYGRDLSPEEDLAFQNQAVAAELNANDIEDATDEVMADLAEFHPGVVEKIVKNERNLDANYGDIKRFLHNLNDQIDELAKQDSAKDTEIARLAVELADSQAMFKKYVARERSRDKRNDKSEQKIKDLLVNAQKNLKSVNQKAMKELNLFGEAVSGYTKRTQKSVVKGLPKIKRLTTVAGPVEEVVVQGNSGGGLRARLQSRMGNNSGGGNS